MISGLLMFLLCCAALVGPTLSRRDGQDEPSSLNDSGGMPSEPDVRATAVREAKKTALFALWCALAVVAASMLIPKAEAAEHEFSWQAPTEYIDGSVIEPGDLVEFRVYCDYGQSFDGHDREPSFKGAFPGEARTGSLDFPEGYDSTCSMTAVALGDEESLELHPFDQTGGCRRVGDQVLCESDQSNQVQVTIPLAPRVPPMPPVLNSGASPG